MLMPYVKAAFCATSLSHNPGRASDRTTSLKPEAAKEKCFSIDQLKKIPFQDEDTRPDEMGLSLSSEDTQTTTTKN